MIVYAGVQNTSFAAGRADLANLARLGAKNRTHAVAIALRESLID